MRSTSSTFSPTGPRAPRCRAAGSAMTSGGRASSSSEGVVGGAHVVVLQAGGWSYPLLPPRARKPSLTTVGRSRDGPYDRGFAWGERGRAGT